MSQNEALTTVEQIRNLKASNRQYRARCASLERQVARLSAEQPCKEHEKEIARLEEMVFDLTTQCTDQERNIHDLRLQLLKEIAA